MSLIHPNQLNSLVSIGKHDHDKHSTLATGFLAGFIEKKVSAEQYQYRIFLVTNRHVFDGLSDVLLRFNKIGEEDTEEFKVPLMSADRKPLWLKHQDPSVDLALLSVPFEALKGTLNCEFCPENMFAYFGKDDFQIGDEVYTLGFPMGISGDLKNYSILREGTIARIDKEIISRRKFFMIDSTILPGNSGSPVFIKPNRLALPNTKIQDKVRLIGVVSGHVPYIEPLYSHQSDPPEVAGYSVENSHLGLVIPMDFAKEIFDDWKQRGKVEIENTGK